MAVRDRDERPRLRGSMFADRRLREAREPVRSRDREHREDDGQEAPLDDCDQDRDREPHEAVAADPRQEDEDVIERGPPMVDDPPLGFPVPAGQTGAICLVWSISCWRSNGLPTNACAPLEAACVRACSSSCPLNITTGMAPAPYWS